ncbi:MAG TPA: hypothetical protein VMF51_17020 [Nocardioides sp.]|uniref:hypothetical protein n=1 Tax=Nocardioides sp. TaxID=35761 RepID=UPI002C29AD83|nr:hypothetical protein [Nocardioides sp.]HTW16838.1 hypothetical protein [Nocardioides sp.]
MSAVRRCLVLISLAVVGLLAVDGGSVLLTRLATPDELESAGQKAAAVVAHRSEGVPTPQTAMAALEAARAEAGEHEITLSEDDFLVYADDSVELTGVATAPTLLLQRVPFLADLAEVTTTMTVEPRTIDSSGPISGSTR